MAALLAFPLLAAQTPEKTILFEGGTGGHRGYRILFTNPESLPRNDLRIRLSYDEGRTWPFSQLLQAGPTGYSDMAAGPDGDVHIIYEQVISGGAAPGQHNIIHTRFSLEWLTGGKDKFE